MQISAFVDGELPDNESELLLRRLSQDAELRRQAGQYIQIGRLIRRERDVPGMGELRHRILAALGEQPEGRPVTAEQSPRRLLRPAAGFAVAATVAVAALFGIRQVEIPGAAELADESAAAGQATQQVAGYTEPLPEEALSSRPGDMLTQYYLSHGATSADLGANGILTRLVTLELREGELVEAAEPAPADKEAADEPAADDDNASKP